MSEEPFYIVMKHVEEHENGDATYTFDMSDKAAQSVIEEHKQSRPSGRV